MLLQLRLIYHLASAATTPRPFHPANILLIVRLGYQTPQLSVTEIFLLSVPVQILLTLRLPETIIISKPSLEAW